MITIQQLRQICPTAPKNADVFIPHLNHYMPVYGITTPLQIAMFIAQVAHESGGFRYVREIASGKAYEGRKDLGNTILGDGVKYKGRGLIQVTGKFNYKECGKSLILDLLTHPELLEVPEYAVAASCWFWSKNRLNHFADIKDLKGCTMVINGGLNGLANRQQYYDRALDAFGIN